jgi:uncharacterized protein (TIGR03083 family)
MDFPRLHDCLGENYRLLRAAVMKATPSTRVPSCPEWSAADLVMHLANVYLHKAECMRLGKFPEDWTDSKDRRDPLGELQTAYETLERQFGGHTPDAYAPTWAADDQTVGFWIRRMAQETVIHRVDAELAAGIPLSPIPDDIALDGVDELLHLFLAHGSVRWRDYLGDLFKAPDERAVIVHTTNGQAWKVTAKPGQLITEHSSPDAYGDLTVAAPPVPLLLWLWNRAPDTAVTLSGDPDLLDQFHSFRAALT